MESIDVDSIVEARIHPAIGIARVGNARCDSTGEDFFIGPEVPNPVDEPPPGGYRDSAGRLKRQAARFRLYGYDRDGNVVGEITDKIARIEWHVHVANKKAAWYNFDVALDLPDVKAIRSPRRNAHIRGSERGKLSINPGERSVCLERRCKSFDTGKFFGEPVYLGEIRYWESGSLLFIGGRGVSRPASPAYALTTFANNAGWHDDVSDGPVWADVEIKAGNRKIRVDEAWVVTAPPNYAPNLVASQPLYDVILAASQAIVPAESKPSFTRHILPIFRQFQDSQWVNAGFAMMFGARGVTDFTRPEFIQKLATLPANPSDPDIYLELRRQIFFSFRNPKSPTFEPLAWPPLYGDEFFFEDDPPSPRVAFSITGLSYHYLSQWTQGDFIADYQPSAKDPQSLDDVPRADRPAALDRAALHFCAGGPFHPGCEMTWIMRQSCLYRGLFRIRRRPDDIHEPDYGEFMTADLATADGGPLSVSGPGDITRWLAVPWQTDTASCRAGYPGMEFPESDLIPAFWPSRVPNTVLTEENYRIVIDAKRSMPERLAAFHQRESWLDPLRPDDPYLTVIGRMIDGFHGLGVLERRVYDVQDDFPKLMYVENLPPESDRAKLKPKSGGRPEIQDILRLRRHKRTPGV